MLLDSNFNPMKNDFYKVVYEEVLLKRLILTTVKIPIFFLLLLHKSISIVTKIL